MDIFLAEHPTVTERVKCLSKRASLIYFEVGCHARLCILRIAKPTSDLFTRLLPRTDCTRCTSGTCRRFYRDRSRIPAESRSNTRRRTSRCRATKKPRFCRRCIRQAPFRHPDSWGTDLVADRIYRPFRSLPRSKRSARLIVASKRLASSRRSSRRRHPGDYVGAN